MKLPKKRKSGGRTKGKQGRATRVQCDKCGAQIPIDKAKRVTVYYSPVDYRLAKELRAQGTRIPRYKKTKTYCISCAIHTRKIKIRSKEDRRKNTPL
ncbi:MAG: 30S ribosomal protein S26e [Candidatus Lokiarchaeota archaeon]|nr:30S ribosomal protein S26e [Candidatus Lokiarchaeota archaeon]